jgi:hypothetical protein
MNSFFMGMKAGHSVRAMTGQLTVDEANVCADVAALLAHEAGWIVVDEVETYAVGFATALVR